MKQFLIILEFELQHYFKNKIFAGITTFLVLAIGVVMFFPRISGLFKNESESTEPEQRKVMLVQRTHRKKEKYWSRSSERRLRIIMFRRQQRA